HADDVFLTALPQGSDEGHVPREVKLGKVAQFFIGQPLFGLEKAKIHRTAAQTLEERQQTLLVVGSDGPDVDGAAIAQQFVRGVVVWLRHTHCRPPWYPEPPGSHRSRSLPRPDRDTGKVSVFPSAWTRARVRQCMWHELSCLDNM